MKTDYIKEISIDDLGRLCIFPEKEKFNLIWRSATEVHWDNEKSFLYSPQPREWSYYDWFKHITSTIIAEYNCKLLVNDKTSWVNISETLMNEISQQ